MTNTGWDVRSAVRRLFAGLFVVAATMLAAGVAAPAAARAPLEVAIEIPDMVLSPAAAKTQYLTIRHNQPGDVTLRQVRVVVDASGLAGVASVSPASFSRCSAAGAVITCLVDVMDVSTYGSNLLAFTFSAAPGAEVGRQASLRMTLTADGVSAVNASSTVTIAEGVNLSDASGPFSLSAAPGGAVTVPLAVRNSGEGAVTAVKLFVSGDYALAPERRYRNCEYVGAAMMCSFDSPLRPGATYALSESLPFGLRPDTRAPGVAFKQYMWGTPADFAEWFGDEWRDRDPVAGSGAALRLVEQQPSGARTQQTDVDQRDNWGDFEVAVTGTNPLDLTAVGAQVAGEVGAVVTVTVGVHNGGTATADANLSGEAVTHALIVVPPGASVTAAPASCSIIGADDSESTPGQPGGRQYRCYSGSFLKVGDSETWSFSMRIDEKIVGAEGSIKINALDVDAPDANQANDTAKIILNGAGSAGGLPITGVNTVSAVAAGLVLVVLGVVGYRLGRRRPARFIA